MEVTEAVLVQDTEAVLQTTMLEDMVDTEVILGKYISISVNWKIY